MSEHLESEVFYSVERAFDVLDSYISFESFEKAVADGIVKSHLVGRQYRISSYEIERIKDSNLLGGDEEADVKA